MDRLREATPERYYRNTLLQWFGVAEKRKKYSYYLHLYFNSQFKIILVETNLPFVVELKSKGLLPKTLYRYLDFLKHIDLLKLYYKLRYASPNSYHNIYLHLNKSSIQASGKLIVITKNKKYRLSLQHLKIMPTVSTVDLYQETPTYLRTLAYNLYNTIHTVPLNESIRISNILQSYPYSRTILYESFKRVIGVSPSIVLRDRRLLSFVYHLLHTDESITNSYAKFGFSNTSHLHKYFKAHFNTTPVSFREKYFKK